MAKEPVPPSENFTPVVGRGTCMQYVHDDRPMFPLTEIEGLFSLQSIKNRLTDEQFDALMQRKCEAGLLDQGGMVKRNLTAVVRNSDGIIVSLIPVPYVGCSENKTVKHLVDSIYGRIFKQPLKMNPLTPEKDVNFLFKSLWVSSRPVNIVPSELYLKQRREVNFVMLRRERKQTPSGGLQLNLTFMDHYQGVYQDFIPHEYSLQPLPSYVNGKLVFMTPFDKLQNVDLLQTLVSELFPPQEDDIVSSWERTAPFTHKLVKRRFLTERRDMLDEAIFRPNLVTCVHDRAGMMIDYENRTSISELAIANRLTSEQRHGLLSTVQIAESLVKEGISPPVWEGDEECTQAVEHETRNFMDAIANYKPEDGSGGFFVDSFNPDVLKD